MAAIKERISVEHYSDTLRARQTARDAASAAGFDGENLIEIEIAVSELASNLVKHGAVDGTIYMETLNTEQGCFMEIRAEDKGPGIKNVNEALSGECSTAGTLGIGLSSVKRLMDEFSLSTSEEQGTIVVARKWLDKEHKHMKFSVIARPKSGEDLSGDAYFIKQDKGHILFGITDALGHGKEAHEVACSALKCIEENRFKPLDEIVYICHEELRKSRGAAISVCRVFPENGRFEHVCIGNVATRIFGSPSSARPFCHNGTLGMSMERFGVNEYPYRKGDVFVMYSDGIAGGFDISPLDFCKNTQEIASLIFDGNFTGKDDATVLVGK